MKTTDDFVKGLDVIQKKLETFDQFESTMSQVSKALLSKENATPDELLQAASQVKTRLAQVERERDACIKDIQQCQGAICNSCKHHYRPNPEIRHYACAILGEFDTFLEDGDGKPFVCGRFEWRGVCEENTKEG